METEKVRMNITLPATIAKELKRATAPRKRSQFVAEAIKLQLEKQKEKELKALLKEGYLAEKASGLEITREFERVDLEGWEDD